MYLLLIIGIALLLANLVKAAIDINTYRLLLSKDNSLTKTPNPLNKKYQFIKGLF